MNLSVEPNDRVTFRIAHEDDALVVVEKPTGVPTQPGKGADRNTLLNGLFALHGSRLQNLGRARDFGLLHRLDRSASGLLVVALKPRAYDGLRAAFENRTIGKFYWAIVRGRPNGPSGTIRRPIAEESGEKKTARISPSGKPALTAYRVLQAAEEASLLECRTLTGRLHQVRVHLASISCPIFGDDLYAPRSVAQAWPRLALHAHRLTFAHPISGEKIDVRTKWPKDLSPLLRRLGLSRPGAGDAGHQVRGDAVGKEEPGVGEAPR